MNYKLLPLFFVIFSVNALGDDINNKFIKNKPVQSTAETKPKEYELKPGYLMKEKEPEVRIQVQPSRRIDYGTTIINTMPNGSYIEYGTRVAPIVVERHYYNVPQVNIQGYENAQVRPQLSRSQQEQNYSLLVDNLNKGVASVVDLGYGYLMPGPNGTVYYHTKSGEYPPMPVDQFFLTDEYRYLTGQR